MTKSSGEAPGVLESPQNKAVLESLFEQVFGKKTADEYKSRGWERLMDRGSRSRARSRTNERETDTNTPSSLFDPILDPLRIEVEDEKTETGPDPDDEQEQVLLSTKIEEEIEREREWWEREKQRSRMKKRGGASSKATLDTANLKEVLAASKKRRSMFRDGSHRDLYTNKSLIRSIYNPNASKKSKDVDDCEDIEYCGFPLAALSGDMLYNVFLHLHISDIASILSVCTSFAEPAEDAILAIFYSLFGEYPGALKRPTTLRMLAKAHTHSRDNMAELFLWSSARGYTFYINRMIADKLVLELPKGINVSKENGNTACHIACERNQMEVLEILVAAGADLHKLGNKGRHVLHVAAAMGRADILHYLLSNNSFDVDCVDESLSTPLHLAATHGREEAVRVLLEFEADQNLCNTDGKSALYLAAEEGKRHVLHVLLEGGSDVTLASETGKTPLYAAAENGFTKCVELLLDYGSNVRQETFRQKIPLYPAAEKSHIEIVRLLLPHSHVEDLFILSVYGTTAMSIAAKQPSKAIKKMFLLFCLNQEIPPKGQPLPASLAKLKTPRYIEDLGGFLASYKEQNHKKRVKRGQSPSPFKLSGPGDKPPRGSRESSKSSMGSRRDDEKHDTPPRRSKSVIGRHPSSSVTAATASSLRRQTGSHPRHRSTSDESSASPPPQHHRTVTSPPTKPHEAPKATSAWPLLDDEKKVVEVKPEAQQYPVKNESHTLQGQEKAEAKKTTEGVVGNRSPGPSLYDRLKINVPSNEPVASSNPSKSSEVGNEEKRASPEEPAKLITVQHKPSQNVDLDLTRTIEAAGEEAIVAATQASPVNQKVRIEEQRRKQEKRRREEFLKRQKEREEKMKERMMEKVKLDAEKRNSLNDTQSHTNSSKQGETAPKKTKEEVESTFRRLYETKTVSAKKRTQPLETEVPSEEKSASRSGSRKESGDGKGSKQAEEETKSAPVVSEEEKRAIQEKLNSYFDDLKQKKKEAELAEKKKKDEDVMKRLRARRMALKAAAKAQEVRQLQLEQEAKEEAERQKQERESIDAEAQAFDKRRWVSVQSMQFDREMFGNNGPLDHSHNNGMRGTASHTPSGSFHNHSGHNVPRRSKSSLDNYVRTAASRRNSHQKHNPRPVSGPAHRPLFNNRKPPSPEKRSALSVVEIEPFNGPQIIGRSIGEHSNGERERGNARSRSVLAHVAEGESEDSRRGVRSESASAMYGESNVKNNLSILNKYVSLYSPSQSESADRSFDFASTAVGTSEHEKSDPASRSSQHNNHHHHQGRSTAEGISRSHQARSPERSPLNHSSSHHIFQRPTKQSPSPLPSISGSGKKTGGRRSSLKAYAAPKNPIVGSNGRRRELLGRLLKLYS